MRNFIGDSFNQNFNENFVDTIRAGVLAMPAGGTAEPFVDARDIADVVVAALTDERHIGELYELTGPRLLTLADAAAELGAAMGREVTYLPVTPEDFAAEMVAHGMPEQQAVPVSELFDFARECSSFFRMRRVGTAIWGLLLCGALASSPALVEAASEHGNRPTETTLPAEIEEQLSDPKVDERNHDKAKKGTPFLSSTVDEPTSHSAAWCSRLPLARVARRDDPSGSLTHGLRAPPA